MDAEYVILHNAAILKCSVPSFVADFVSVEGWVDDEEKQIVPSKDFSESKPLHVADSFVLKKPVTLFIVYIYCTFYFFQKLSSNTMTLKSWGKNS